MKNFVGHHEIPNFPVGILDFLDKNLFFCNILVNFHFVLDFFFGKNGNKLLDCFGAILVWPIEYLHVS